MPKNVFVDVWIDVSYNAVAASKKVAPMVASKKVRTLFVPPLLIDTYGSLDREQYYQVESSPRSA